MTSAEPGWYPDPSTSGHLRLWDGSGWTDQTRAADRREPPPRRPLRGGPLTVVAVLTVAAAAAAALAWALSGAHSHGATAAPPGHPTAHLPGNPACSVAARANGALRVVAWFDREGLGAASSPVPVPTLTGQCSAAAFTVIGFGGLGRAYLLPDAGAAARALSPLRASPRPAFASGAYLVSLDPSAAPRQEAFREALDRFSAANPQPSH